VREDFRIHVILEKEKVKEELTFVKRRKRREEKRSNGSEG